jgi:hypothetical protein
MNRGFHTMSRNANRIRKLVWLFTGHVLMLTALAADLTISRFSTNSLAVTNSYSEGVVSVLSSPAVEGPWAPIKNAFSLMAT